MKLIQELLSVRATVTEGAMKDLHADLVNAIEDEFGCNHEMCERIADWLANDKDDAGVEEFLYDHFVERNEMPYGTMKARAGDPSNWIADKMVSMFKKELDPIWKTWKPHR